MEYIRLENFQNQYPSAESYKSRVKDFLTLEGKYPQKNKIDFKISPVNEMKLDDIKSVDGTSFRFVLSIKEKASDRNGRYYTSSKFLKDLQSSISDSNPYFITNALKKEFIVEYVLEDIRKLVKDFRKDEFNNFKVTVNKHFFINANDTIDYETFVKYIDYIVSTPSISDANKGVIPAINLLPVGSYKIDSIKLKSFKPIDFNAGKFSLPTTPNVPPSTTPPSTQTGGGGSSSGGNTSGGRRDGAGNTIGGSTMSGKPVSAANTFDTSSFYNG